MRLGVRRERPPEQAVAHVAHLARQPSAQEARCWRLRRFPRGARVAVLMRMLRARFLRRGLQLRTAGQVTPNFSRTGGSTNYKAIVLCLLSFCFDAQLFRPSSTVNLIWFLQFNNTRDSLYLYCRIQADSLEFPAVNIIVFRFKSLLQQVNTYVLKYAI